MVISRNAPVVGESVVVDDVELVVVVAVVEEDAVVPEKH